MNRPETPEYKEDYENYMALVGEMEQDLFIANGNFDSRTLADLLEEFSYVCRANMIFFRNLTEEAWSRTGTVNDYPASVSALAYNMVNHFRHHLDSLRTHYFPEISS